MDNRCSKGHQLFNPTMIRKGRIILASYKGHIVDQPKCDKTQRKKINKFKASIRSSNILLNLQRKDNKSNVVASREHSSGKVSQELMTTLQIGGGSAPMKDTFVLDETIRNATIQNSTAAPHLNVSQNNDIEFSQLSLGKTV